MRAGCTERHQAERENMLISAFCTMLRWCDAVRLSCVQLLCSAVLWVSPLWSGEATACIQTIPEQLPGPSDRLTTMLCDSAASSVAVIFTAKSMSSRWPR